MTARTYVDAVGVMQAWINSRTGSLVGPGAPLQMGAHLKLVGGGEPATYAFLEEQLSTQAESSAENPDMLAALSAQVYGGTRQAATNGAVALAEELSRLDGAPVPVPSAGAVILAVDNIQGPSWFPDGDHPRLLLNWLARVQPA